MDDATLALLEDRTRHAVAGSLRAAIVALERVTAGVYTAAATDHQHKLPELARETVRRQLLDTLAGLIAYDYADTRRVLVNAARTALAGGAADLGLNVRDTLPLDVRQALVGLTDGMRADLREALRLARVSPLERWGDVVAVTSLARKALNRADSTATWVVHRAHNEGRTRGIDRLWSQGQEVHRLWRAERGACLRCLGFAGALAVVGEPFHPVLEVADPSAGRGPLAGPPAHPYCRCSVEWYFGPLSVTSLDLPYALRREAQRSIASGSANASGPASVRAADRLLDVAHLLIPKTVQKRAKKAIATGAFEK